MAIQKEIWVNYIAENLYKDNEFMNMCFQADSNVLNGKVVHIPQAGGPPVVEKNRTSLPATVTKRIDQDIAYVIDQYTTDPDLIENADQFELSYDKLTSVLFNHVSKLGETLGDNLLVQWLETSSFSGADLPIPAATVIRTTGPAVAATLPSATGNRKKFLKEDLGRAQTLLNKQNIPRRDRYALVSSDLYAQLKEDEDLKRRDRALELNLREGEVLTLYGFQILERSTTATYDNAGTPVVKPVGSTEAADDNDSVVCWQRDAVERARGSIDFFERTDDPQWYGDIYSALVRFGGRKRRADGKGIVAIVQDAA